MKSYWPYSPDQSYLLPPSPSEWLPQGHLAYFILDLVADLDLSEIERPVQARDHRGERPYSPRMMTALLLYGYAVGVFSSRKIERATSEDVAFRVLAAGEHPHFTTINEFRLAHRASFADLFQQVLQLCMSAGLVKLGHVAIDGTKMKANASKHKAMSYDRMEKEETRLKAEVEQLLAQADAVDAAEDKLYGVGQQPKDLPAELQRREGRRERIRELRAALEKEAAKARAVEHEHQADELRRTAAEPTIEPRRGAELMTRAAQHDQQAADLDDDDPDPPAVDGDLPRNSPPADASGTPKPNAQRNFTDPDSRIMMRDGGFVQAYNAQIAVDEGNQIIVAAALSNQGTDAQYFEPMLRRVVENCDAVPALITGDAGYFSSDNVLAAERMGTEPLLSVAGHRSDGQLDESRSDLPHLHTEPRAAMRARLLTPQGRAAYARRKATVEPVFGQIRSCRGFRQLSLRGLFKARCEWLLVCATHNLLKLWRAATKHHQLVAAT
ncbi:MAG TPA: IS1182 family transposase [Solirubrobacteraceae bacterium]|nr:IS1182 family transposase [Solirubrobacteraceae bacterium]